MGNTFPRKDCFFYFFLFFSWYLLKKHFQPQIQEESFHVGHLFMRPARLVICRNHPKPDPRLRWCWEGSRASREPSYIVPQGFKAVWPFTGCRQERQQPADFFCWVSSPKLGHAGLNLLFYDNSEQHSSGIPGSEFCPRLFRSGTPNFTPGKKKGKKRMPTPAKAEHSSTPVSNSFFIHLSVNTGKSQKRAF